MINNATLIGRLTKDPGLHYTTGGAAVAIFTLAVNHDFTNQNGNREASFVSCMTWRKPAETMATLAKKGSLIGVAGRIQTQTYNNQQGQRVYVTKVVVDNLQLLENEATTKSRTRADQSSSSPSPTTFEQQDVATPSNNRLNASQNPFGRQSVDINDDDSPF